ncbi:MAG: hypothetical protein HY735_20720 [Verrucomicrobia bacterium]|nr:hypothetical protein [Verrucomicrobiota bacterium]
MKVWKVILAAFVIFAAGAVTGGLTVSLNSRPKASPGKGPPSSAVSRPRGTLVDRCQRELDLTQPQRAKIELIFRESDERSKKLWDAAREEHRRLKAGIRETLTPEQQQKFDEVFKPREFGKPGDPRSRDGRRGYENASGQRTNSAQTTKPPLN